MGHDFGNEPGGDKRQAFSPAEIAIYGTVYPMRNLMNRLPLSLLIVLCLTLGLAPFAPQPHLWEKLGMLLAGELSKPIDIFDLLLHGTPWLLLIVKLLLPAGDKREN